ncbi:hypothetical protein MNBD_GAMMA13-1936 [hydrothermal vent metagenome]|uniref:PqqD family peptide modification chaperone n=1 Tax=hydrothermal vent metagenome TaxID=652676 RepID=A0A3B0YN71_9ZZZZ
MRIHSYLLGNEILLYSDVRQAIYRLNPSASFMWCCYEEGLADAQIVAELVETFPVDEAQAKHDLATTFDEWRQLGLLGESPESQGIDEYDSDDKDNSGSLPIDQRNIDTLPECDIACYYRILDQMVEIRYSDKALLEAAGVALDSLLIDIATPCQHHFTVARTNNGFVILFGDRMVEHCQTLDELAPLVLAQVVSSVYLDTPCLLALHAAAVGKQGQMIVMPAESGSGKSTLTAAMAASGFDYYTDELVLVAHDTHRLLTAAVGIGIKPGSWAVLNKYYPDLMQYPVHPRPDGKQVRYFAAPITRQTLPEDKNYMRALVFPVYTPGQSADLSPVSTADAICRLTAAGYDIEGGLSREAVEELIDWTGDQECYQLLFDDLKEAVTIADGLLA